MDPDEDDTLFIFSIGSNDCVRINKTNKTMVNSTKFKSNMLKLINAAKIHSNNIIILGLIPVDEAKVDPIPWFDGHSCKNNLIMEFDKVLSDIAKTSNVLYLDLYNGLQDSKYSSLLADGEHPKTEGHRKIFEIIIKFLIEKNIISK